MATPKLTRAQLAKLRQVARERFLKVRIAEREYQAHLAAVGRQIAALVRGFTAKGRQLDATALDRALTAYSHTLYPWAEAVADRMIADVNQRDLYAWRLLTKEIGSGLYRELMETPVGDIHRRLQAEQVQLITSLPLDAAKRAHELTFGGLLTGRRAEDIAKEIEASGQVAAGRARTIARTEVGRTASNLVQARAQYVGSPGYLWRGVMDADERKEHVRLEGKFIAWDNPPIAGRGKGGVAVRAHAGCIWNCRCWPEVIMSDTII